MVKQVENNNVAQNAIHRVTIIESTTAKIQISGTEIIIKTELWGLLECNLPADSMS